MAGTRIYVENRGYEWQANMEQLMYKLRTCFSPEEGWSIKCDKHQSGMAECVTIIAFRGWSDGFEIQFSRPFSNKSEVQVRWKTRGNEFVNALVGDKLQKVVFGIGMVVGCLAGFVNLLFQWVPLNTGIGKLDTCVNLGLGIIVVGIPLMALVMAPFWLISKIIERRLGWGEGELEEARV
jgi:hypothetical protein